LLGKWIWCLCQIKGGLWKDIIESKYGGWRSLREQRVLNFDSLWWRDLKEVWEHEVWVRPLKIVSGGNSVMERSYFYGKIIGWVLIV